MRAVSEPLKKDSSRLKLLHFFFFFIYFSEVKLMAEQTMVLVYPKTPDILIIMSIYWPSQSIVRFFFFCLSSDLSFLPVREALVSPSATAFEFHPSQMLQCCPSSCIQVCHLQIFLNIVQGNKVDTTPATSKAWIQVPETKHAQVTKSNQTAFLESRKKNRNKI